MIDINDAHQWILKTLKKSYGSFASPGDLDRAINSGSLDVYNQQIKTMREEGKMPALLKNFRTSSTETPSSGTVTIATPDIEIFSLRTNTGKFPVKILETEEEWVSRKLEDMDIDPANNLPLNYYQHEEEYTGTQINAGADLPADFIKEVSASISITEGDYEGLIVTPDMFYSKQLLDLIGSRNREQEITHLVKQEQDYALTAASNRYQDLPGNFVKEVNIFLKDAQNNYFEGDILSDQEFAERIDSAILTPDTEHPIARIVGNQIEFFPKPTGGDTYNYVLSYKEFPTRTRPVFKVEDNKLYARPTLDSGDAVKLIYYKYPVDERPIARVYGVDDTSVKIDILPTTVGDVDVYYLSKPVKPVFGFTTTNGVVTYASGSSTHLDWDYKAFNLIMTRALFYLGYGIKDGQMVEIPAARNAIESSQDLI